MTREEAIAYWEQRSEHIHKWLEENEDVEFIGEYVDAIDMAIEALQADTVSREEYDDVKAYMEKLVDAFIEDGEELADSVKVVRCKDCRHKCTCNREIRLITYSNYSVTACGKSIDYCSHGERAEKINKVKYPKPINEECVGCVHRDEIGRCLNFMLAKSDRSCFRDSWNDDTEQTEYKLPFHDEIMEKLDKLTVKEFIADEWYRENFKGENND